MAELHSAQELMEKSGCESMRQFRAWLRKNRIKFIDAPGGPLVPHEALVLAAGLDLAQNDPAPYDPQATI